MSYIISWAGAYAGTLAAVNQPLGHKYASIKEAMYELSLIAGCRDTICRTREYDDGWYVYYHSKYRDSDTSGASAIACITRAPKRKRKGNYELSW